MAVHSVDQRSTYRLIDRQWDLNLRAYCRHSTHLHSQALAEAYFNGSSHFSAEVYKLELLFETPELLDTVFWEAFSKSAAQMIGLKVLEFAYSIHDKNCFLRLASIASHLQPSVQRLVMTPVGSKGNFMVRNTPLLPKRSVTLKESQIQYHNIDPTAHSEDRPWEDVQQWRENIAGFTSIQAFKLQTVCLVVWPPTKEQQINVMLDWVGSRRTNLKEVLITGYSDTLEEVDDFIIPHRLSNWPLEHHIGPSMLWVRNTCPGWRIAGPPAQCTWSEDADSE